MNNNSVKAYKTLKGPHIYRIIYLIICVFKKLYYYTFILFKVLNNSIAYYYLVKENLFKAFI